LLWPLAEVERSYENARGCRWPNGLQPFIVVCREVWQSSLGKLVCVCRKAPTAFRMRFQEVRVHGCPPRDNTFNFARRIRLIYGPLERVW
jgi:hypothetical protein